MAITGINSARVSLTQKLALAQRQLSANQSSLVDVQTQLTTGKRINQISDDPAAAGVILQLRKTLADRSSYLSNLQSVSTNLSQVDSTLGTLTDLLRQAGQTASANVGSIVSDSERQAAASVIDNIYNQALSLANKQFQGSYLFGGDRATNAPYASDLGGVRFDGSQNALSNAVDSGASLALGAKASDIFGAASAGISADLTPALSMNTRLSDLRGALGEGFRAGSIVLSDGSTSGVVDLTKAQTVGDVVNAINNAGIGALTAAIAGPSIQINGNAADSITITDTTGGHAAADLGILQIAPAGAPITGQSLQSNITPLTQLSDLRGGMGFDQAAGFVITNGTKSATINTANMSTVEDLFNAIQSVGVGAIGRVSADGSGIEIVNAVQGTDMTLSENGGTTAADLGIRSMTPTTLLSSLNSGAGVRLGSGNDLQLALRDGSTVQVDLSSARTIQDVMDAINLAGGGNVSAAFSTTTNGITLTDLTGGAGNLVVTSLSGSSAAHDLGLDGVASGNVLAGRDVNPQRASGVFASLAALRDAMLHNDQSGMTAAAEKLQAGLDHVVLVRGQVGAQAQEAENRQTQIEDQNTATKALMSDLEDVNYNEAITRYQTLQTALQAQLQTTGKLLGQSLLDYLQ